MHARLAWSSAMLLKRRKLQIKDALAIHQ